MKIIRSNLLSRKEVSDLAQGATFRFQDARLYLDSHEKELLLLDFYPHLAFAWGWESRELLAVPFKNLIRENLRAIKQPFILYLKAHFVGHLLVEFRNTESQVEFFFQDGRSFAWDLEKKEWIFKVDSKKDYKQRLPHWASLSDKLAVEAGELSTPDKQAELRADKSTDKNIHKFEQLKKNVESDIAEADAWLAENKPHIEFFFKYPQLWGTTKLPDKHTEWIKEIHKTIPFLERERKTSLEKLKKNLSRFERKKIKAQERLGTLRSESYKPRSSKGVAPSISKSKTEKLSLGKKIELAPGLEAIVGRKATENDSLYKAAHSRDLWFHVRGQKGAHVWIKRGQKLFGAKDELAKVFIEQAALLAVKHSKASGASVAVDYTERRHLKKPRRAAEGALLVLQSKTIFVSL